ncbi:MAG: DUF4974 domain-containing protein [Prevotella sp.]|nr:DUF4974 domain-containing protein [Prevotella sp.]MBR0049000.1 DUF4974 domain-containing protein [Prevotella sp.]
MMTDKQLIARFLEMQEHPEVTDEQLRQILSDEQMHELVEQMAFTKRAFKNEETLTEEPAIADEWEKFATAHAEELDALDEDTPKPRFALHLAPRKIAASFIGVLLASGIAFAAIQIVRSVGADFKSPTHETRISNPRQQVSDSTRQSSPLPLEGSGEAVITFDNVPLDTMLLEMADYYHVSVEFEREEARQLRFHFVWKLTDDLDRLVEKLNNFEAVNIIREPEKLIVR